MGVIRNGNQVHTQLVQKFIGSAFDTVKSVADDLGNVNTVASNIADVNTVAGIAGDITQAVSSVAQFNNVYYGSLLSEPTVRPDSTPIEEGDLYYNNVANQLYIYQGTVWIPMGSIQNTVEVQTAIEGQTVFNLGNSYIPGANNLIVLVNGTFQFSTDASPSGAYAENTSTRVTFTEGLVAGDTVVFIIGTAVSTTNPNIQVVKKQFVATAGQQLFTLPAGTTYAPESGNIKISVNGVEQYPSEYSETSTTSFTFLTGLEEGDAVLVTIGNIISNIPVAVVNSVAVSLVSEIRNTDYTGKKFIQVIGERGNPSYYLDPADITSLDDDFLVVIDNGGNRWKLKHDGVIDARWAGVVMDGITDSTVAVQKAHSSGLSVGYPAGHVIINTPKIEISAGSYIFGVGGGRFSYSIQARTFIENINPTGGVFWYTQDTSTGQVNAPCIGNMMIKARYPIKYNDETVTITDGGASPYLMKPVFEKLTLISPESGTATYPSTGVGIFLSKVFDFDIRNCDINQFNAGIILQGCDIGRVKTNRIQNSTSYHILEIACSTFGSQNEIAGNDLLAGRSTSTIFFKSNSRHVRFINNYLEQSASLGDITGFIDISDVSHPSFGANTPVSTQYSIEVDQNRIDGFNKATSFGYRLDPTAVYTKLRDVGTVGTSGANDLVIVGTYLPVLYNVSHKMFYDIFSPNFDELPSFKTKNLTYSADMLEITPESFTTLSRSGLYANLYYTALGLSKESIVIKPTFDHPTDTEVLKLIPEGVTGALNPYFVNGDKYIVEVVARCENIGGETLKIARIVNGAGDTLNSFALGIQYKTYRFVMSGAAYTDEVGLYLARTNTNNSNIHIKSIRIKKTIQYKGTTTYSSGGIAAGATVAFNVVTTGAKLGDYATVAPPDAASSNGLVITATVVAADTVKVVLYNPTAGTITPTASGVWTVAANNIIP